MKEHNVYFLHILGAINKIHKYVRDLSFEEFSKNDEKKDAVVRNLEIIGEAAGKINAQLRRKYLSIEWRDIMDMRNRLIHEYFGVDFMIVWDVVKKELPILKKKIEKIVKRKSKRGRG